VVEDSESIDDRGPSPCMERAPKSRIRILSTVLQERRPLSAHVGRDGLQKVACQVLRSANRFVSQEEFSVVKWIAGSSRGISTEHHILCVTGTTQVVRYIGRNKKTLDKKKMDEGV
ncbi:unnamed protein product, partial [Nezara viridula]